MSLRLKRFIAFVIALVLLTGVSQIQKTMNHDRNELGLTRIEPLENAPPVLAFTTVALGGFRGLIANALWIRATELQDEDKFFEMAQLADWITKLEPHFVQVWLVQSWNLAYNISVKFKENGPADFSDRWRWVYRGIKLLRDDGLRYNPNEVLIYRELAWFFQHKMGANLDDGNTYYKGEWIKEMAKVFGHGDSKPNLDELLHPTTPDAYARLAVLTNEFKMDPRLMKEIDQRYGPIEWRLPEAHAIYWASVGLEKARLNPTKVNPDDLIQLRRTIYQSMHLSAKRGRLVGNPYSKTFEFGPNLEIIPKVNAAYEQAMQDDPKSADHIGQAHRNFLRDAVYQLYLHNRVADAAKWYQYLGEKYPNKPILDGKPQSLPGTVTLQQFALNNTQENLSEAQAQDHVQSMIEAFSGRAINSMLLDETDEAIGYRNLSRVLREAYFKNIGRDRTNALWIDPVEQIEQKVLNTYLDPKSEVPVEIRNVLRRKFQMPEEPVATNALPPSVTVPVAPGTSNSPAAPK